jgi:hypothetical protein
MSVVVTTPINGRTDDLNEISFPAPSGKLKPLPAASAAPLAAHPRRRVPVALRTLLVRDRRRDGPGGDRLGTGKLLRRRAWHLVSWNDLDGD